MPSLLDPALTKALKKDIELLEHTQLPIVTVSASFKEDLKGYHGYRENELIPDVVFSRAHYSMAVGVALQAWGKSIDPKKAWIVDPTNYVSHQDWRKIQLTEVIGKTIARRPFLKKVKDFIDQFGRSKLPILKSITPPLLHLFKHVDRPILSMHVAAGNVLAAQGKTVVQVVTDPHVRDEYVEHLDLPNFKLCVFDEKTKTDALEKAAILGKTVDPAKIIVTGPPIDPRIIAAKKNKHPWRSGVLKLCLATGGLGTNKDEIREVLHQLLPTLSHQPNSPASKLQLMVYAATQSDIATMVRSLAEQHQIPLLELSGNLGETTLNADQILPAPTDQPLILLHHPQIVDANELLIKYAFPWADGFITKPSGDMAYDAAASGSFLLTLEEWGVWEHNISQIFEQLGIAREAEVEHILAQLAALTDTHHKAQSWVEKAMHNAAQLPPLFLNGSKKIIETVHQN